MQKLFARHGTALLKGVADRNGDCASATVLLLPAELTEAFNGTPDKLLIGIRPDDGKLIAADPVPAIRAIKRFPNAGCRALDQFIADGMAEVVVGRFQAIHVQHDIDPVLPGRPLLLMIFERRIVGQSGQRVQIGQLLVGFQLVLIVQILLHPACDRPALQNQEEQQTDAVHLGVAASHLQIEQHQCRQTAHGQANERSQNVHQLFARIAAVFFPCRLDAQYNAAQQHHVHGNEHPEHRQPAEIPAYDVHPQKQQLCGLHVPQDRRSFPESKPDEFDGQRHQQTEAHQRNERHQNDPICFQGQQV